MLQLQILLSILVCYFCFIKPTIDNKQILLNDEKVEENLLKVVKQRVSFYLYRNSFTPNHMFIKDINKHTDIILQIIKNTFSISYYNKLKKAIVDMEIDDYLVMLIRNDIQSRVSEDDNVFFKNKYEKLKKDMNNMKENLTKRLRSYEQKIAELHVRIKDLTDQNKLLKITSFEETTKILDTMFNKFIDDIFYMEIERPWACKNPDKPTENHYRMPNVDKKEEHKERLKMLMKTTFSKDFLNRLKLYYDETYIDIYLTDKIAMLYEARFIQAVNASAELSKVVRDNLDEIKKKNEFKEKKKIIERNKRLNALVKPFKHKNILPETEEELLTKPDGNRTYQFLKNKYILNSHKYDDLLKTVNNESDIYRDVDKYEFADDKLISLLADELEWNKIQLDPIKIEDAKISLVDTAFKQPPERRFNPFDLMDKKYRVYPEEKVKFGDIQYDLKDRRLNSVLYDRRLYSEESTARNIQEALESKNAVSITM